MPVELVKDLKTVKESPLYMYVGVLHTMKLMVLTNFLNNAYHVACTCTCTNLTCT